MNLAASVHRRMCRKNPISRVKHERRTHAKLKVYIRTWKAKSLQLEVPISHRHIGERELTTYIGYNCPICSCYYDVFDFRCMEDAGQKTAATPETRQAAKHPEANAPALRARRVQTKHITPTKARTNPVAESHIQSECRWSSRCVGGCPRRKGPTCSRCGFEDQTEELETVSTPSLWRATSILRSSRFAMESL